MKNLNWRKNLFYNFLLSFVVCLLLFGILEVFLRIYTPFEFRVKGDKIMLSTNISYNFENTNLKGVNKIVVHKKNSIGFRGEDPPKDFLDRFTIITVGGSTTECFNLSEGSTWPDLLGKRLEINFDKLWINNAGLSGQSTFGHVILMEDYIAKLQPTIALFLIGSNDRTTFQTNKYDQYFLRQGINTQSFKSFIRTLAGSMSNYSEVFAVTYNLYRYMKARSANLDFLPSELTNMEIADLSEEDKKNIRHRFLNYNYEPFRERLGKIVQISRNNNIEPIFVTQPFLPGKAVDDIKIIDLAKIKTQDMNGELLSESYEVLYDIMRKFGEKEGVLVIDLAREMPKSSSYYYDLIHYTNKGADKVSELIYKELCPYLANKYSEFATSNCNN